MRAVPISAALIFVSALAIQSALAASVSVQVTNAAGQPLADAAVYAEPLSGQAVPKPNKMLEIEQKGRKFLPLVSVVQAGTDISFPNNDTVRHHVYSLSPTKVFELKLYSGTPGKPVNFEKPGTVVLGCNIHDTMVAYIHIVNTPWFAKTDAAGRAKLEGLPPGKYQLKAWHFNLPLGAQAAEQPLSLAADDGSASFRLNTKN
ncbi:MAG TPA: methylamine utilization protein [Paucimonas sp.]|nr:methylamine utilization protein [Paucimonas sp.]